ncbi:hypothetical protein EK904_012812 [Melospiza melodia maxima]|nr:hypothetical protein EK904_012812 [Melospiza melodia maxima]
MLVVCKAKKIENHRFQTTKGFGVTSGATEAEGSRVVPRQLLVDQQDLLEIISSSTHSHPAWWIRHKAYLRGGDKDTNISIVNFTFNKNVKIIHRVLGLFGSTGFKVIDLSFKHLQEPSVHMMKLLQRLKIQIRVSTW